MTADGGRFLVSFDEMGSGENTDLTRLESSVSEYGFQIRSKLSLGYLFNSPYRAIQLSPQEKISQFYTMHQTYLGHI